MKIHQQPISAHNKTYSAGIHKGHILKIQNKMMWFDETQCVVNLVPNINSDVIKIKIKDKGRGIADVSEAMTPLYTTGGSDRAGLGFTVMQSFCDRVSVTSSLGIGTTVVLTKKISGRTKW